MLALHLQILPKMRHHVLVRRHILLVIIDKHEMSIELGKALSNPSHKFALDDAIADSQLM
jgi:hypothetical protein